MSRYDTTRDHVMAFLRYGKDGEPGVKPALKTLQDAYATAVEADRVGGRKTAEAEFNRMITNPRAAKLLSEPSYDDWMYDLGSVTEVDAAEFGQPAGDSDEKSGDDGQTPGDEPHGDEPPGDEPPTDRWANAVRKRAKQIRLDREARKLVDDETRTPIAYPPVKDLTALLGEPDTTTEFRIDQVAPTNGRIIINAQYKAGKTTLIGNLIRSLVDGDQFLGKFAVHTQAARIVLIDDELSEHTLRRWLRDQNIVNTGAVADVVTLRGKVSMFNILDDTCRAEWATRFRDLECDYLILDCLRPCMDALGLDENRDAGRFLVAFDALLDEAGIGDASLVQHMGHANERSRGDSRLQDWPDAIWRLVRETEEPDSPRYFTAYGRDVDVSEGLLNFDPVTRRLTYVAGSRKDAKKREALEAALIEVLGVLEEAAGAPMTQRAVIKAASIGQARVVDALGLGVERKRITCSSGANRAKLYSLTNPCQRCGNTVTDLDRAVHHECGR